MAKDPRTFLIKDCGVAKGKQNAATNERKSFFGSLGALGEIEGLGSVGTGLRSLSKISDLVRTGDKANTSGDVPQTGDDVLAAAGINQAQVEQAYSFNPRAVNNAREQASLVADRIKDGKFDLKDLPTSISEIQNLSNVVDGIFTPPVDDTRDFEICGAYPYARDLISFAPKYKFLFITEFEFAGELQLDSKSLAFVIKNTTRPQINFEHEEVNMYNFWVRVPKRTSYEPITMRMYDDNKNSAMKLYETYLKAVSPIANMSFSQGMEHLPGTMEAQSMNFQGIKDAQAIFNGQKHEYTSSFGPVGGTGYIKNVFKRINMYHVYNYGHKMNAFRFINPKIISMELDELDAAENGGGSEISFQFAYDTVNITTGVNVKDHVERLRYQTQVGLYPFDPVFEGGLNDGSIGDGESPGDIEEGGGFMDGVGKVTGAVTGAVSGAINYGTGLVSDAFQATDDFFGSLFSSGSASEASAENQSKGDIGRRLLK